ncbi:acyltransferase [Clostridium sp.]|uniref:acyltransferase family protein n=1 Tax=Clostridium sp. TaxID=1506 RepID=UPI0026310D66|nr:acyltransferase [Clostridium sp.]
MEKIKSDKIESINILKTLAIILVILGHAANGFSGGWKFSSINDSEFIKGIYVYIYSFHMPLFIASSGFLYMEGIIKGKYSNNYEFIKKKFKYLIVPYFIVAIFFVIPIRLIIGYYENNISYIILIKNLLINLFTVRDIGHLWFLPVLFMIFLIFNLLKICFFVNKFIVLIVLIIINLLSYYIPGIGIVRLLLQLLIYFYFGILLRLYYEKLNWQRFDIAIILVIIQIILLYLNNNIINLRIINNIFVILISVVGICIFIILANNICISKCLFTKSRTWRFIYNNGFNMYLFHEPLMYIFMSVMFDMNILSIIPFLIYIIIGVYGTILFIKLIFKIKLIIKEIFLKRVRRN